MTERIIKVTLLDGSIVSMNTEERVIYWQTSDQMIPLATDADSVFDDVLFAIEESQQQINDLKEDKRKIFSVYDEQCARSSEYYNELIFVKGKLAEAQQTIARQREALEEVAERSLYYLRSVAIEALKGEEGETQS